MGFLVSFRIGGFRTPGSTVVDIWKDDWCRKSAEIADLCKTEWWRLKVPGRVIADSKQCKVAERNNGSLRVGGRS